jgi:hypothetical protein
LNNDRLIELIDTRIQKLSLYSARLRRYKENTTRKNQNREFHDIENWKLEKNNIVYAGGLPKLEDATNVWTAIWGQPQELNRDANWLHNEQERVRNTSNMEQTCVTEDVQEAIKETSNWKAPGRDWIQNFWYKKLTVIHKTFATCINKLL